jgi:hypothetical protein
MQMEFYLGRVPLAVPIVRKASDVYDSLRKLIGVPRPSQDRSAIIETVRTIRLVPKSESWRSAHARRYARMLLTRPLPAL